MKYLIHYLDGHFYRKANKSVPDVSVLDGSSLRTQVMPRSNSDRYFKKVYEYSNYALYLDREFYVDNITQTEAKAQRLSFGFEQEYYNFDWFIRDTGLGDKINKRDFEPSKIDFHNYRDINHYCENSTDSQDIFYNDMIDLIEGHNSEVGCYQEEFQVFGRGFDAAHKLILIRFIIDACLDYYSLDPKPNINLKSSGLHTNISIDGNNKKYIPLMIDKLYYDHENFIKLLDKSNVSNRLTGEDETSKASGFVCGVGNRNASVKLKEVTQHDYFEDRRPGSNECPYMLVKYYVNLFEDLIDEL